MELNEIDDTWSSDEKEEYQRLISFGKEIDKFGDIITRWSNNPEVIAKKNEFYRIKQL